MRRYLKLKKPDQVIPALSHELQVLADSWDEIDNAELIGSGYVQILERIGPEIIRSDGC